MPRLLHFFGLSLPPSVFVHFMKFGKRPMLFPKDRELLIKVKAMGGVNPADIEQSQGHYPAPFGASEVLGLEVSGEIRRCREKSKSFLKGRSRSVFRGGRLSKPA